MVSKTTQWIGGKGKTIEEMSLQTFPKKTVSDGADVTFCGSISQSRSSDRKSSIAVVEQRVRQTTSDDDEAERIRWNFSERYGGVSE